MQCVQKFKHSKEVSVFIYSSHSALAQFVFVCNELLLYPVVSTKSRDTNGRTEDTNSTERNAPQELLWDYFYPFLKKTFTTKSLIELDAFTHIRKFVFLITSDSLVYSSCCSGVHLRNSWQTQTCKKYLRC